MNWANRRFRYQTVETPGETEFSLRGRHAIRAHVQVSSTGVAEARHLSSQPMDWSLDDDSPKMGDCYRHGRRPFCRRGKGTNQRAEVCHRRFVRLRQLRLLQQLGGGTHACQSSREPASCAGSVAAGSCRSIFQRRKNTDSSGGSTSSGSCDNVLSKSHWDVGCSIATMIARWNAATKNRTAVSIAARAETADINIYGWADGGIMGNTQSPTSRPTTDRLHFPIATTGNSTSYTA